MIILGVELRNHWLIDRLEEAGFEYLLNTRSGELHRLGLRHLPGSHHLEKADLGEFLALVNIGLVSLLFLEEGAKLPVYDIATGKLLFEYELNRCGHCFPTLSPAGGSAPSALT